MRTTTYHFSLSSMGDCCRARHEASLYRCEGIRVTSAYISDTSSRELTLTVEDDGLEDLPLQKTNVRQIVCDHLDSIGIECVVSDLPDAPFVPFSYLSIFQSHWFLGSIGTGAGIGLLILSLITGTLPLMVTASIAVISVLLTFALGAESYYQAKEQFMQGKLTMDSLFFVSTLTAVLVSVAACFFPGLPMMFDAGLLIFGFRHLGEGIKQSLEQTMGLDVRFQDRTSKTVKKLHPSGDFVETLLSEITVGDEILIEQDVIPVNGVCLVAHCDVDISFVNGDPASHKTKINETLFAGTKLKAGTSPMRMRVSASAADSLLVERDNELARALSIKAPLQIETDRILQYFIPTVFLLAIVSAIVVGSFFSPALAIECAVNVLVSACPCTLSMITSLAIRTGMKKAEDAVHGVQFKSAEELQKADQIDRVVFDLNGTLTAGRPEVRSCNVLDVTMTEKKLFSYCAALEAHSTHSLAEAIRDYAQAHGVDPVIELQKEAITVCNSGLKANIDGKEYAFGNTDMMVEEGIIDFPPVQQEGSLLYLACDKKLLGYVVLAAPLREDAVRVVTLLKALGKQVYICTGDAEDTAMHYATILGIDPQQVYFKCHDKKAVIEALSSDGHYVTMVGDAGNDAAAVAGSYFGVAVQSRGYDKVTRDNAGAVIGGQSLMPIITAFEVAQQTMATIKQNLLFSLGYNLAAITLASGVLLVVGIALSPGIGAALMIIQSSLVLLNTYYFKQQPLTYVTEDEQLVVSSFAQVGRSTPMPSPSQTRSPLPSVERGTLNASVTSLLSGGLSAVSVPPLNELPTPEYFQPVSPHVVY